MLMVIDVGNTNMVFGIYREHALVGNFRMKTDTNRTSDEIGLTVDGYFNRFGLRLEEVEDVVIASVVPQVMYSLTAAVIKYCGRRPLLIGDDLDAGLTYGVESDERLGADRAVACASAIEKYGPPLIVLDYGTATTVDALDGEGRYLGGSIAAGLKISTDALYRSAAMLPRVELAMPERMLGTSTVGQMQAGSVGGYVGATEYLVRRTRAEMPCPPKQVKVVATGGFARMMADNTDVIDIVDLHLILDGMERIYYRQRPSQNA